MMDDAKACRKLLPGQGQLLQLFLPLGFELAERLVDEFFETDGGRECGGLLGDEFVEGGAAEEVFLGDEVISEAPGVEVVPLAGPAAVVAGEGPLFGDE